MREVVTVPRPVRNTHLVLDGPPSLPGGSFVLRTSRRKRIAEVFQDVNRHPWRSEMQVQKVTGLYGARKFETDKSLLALPAGERLFLPRSGAHPYVRSVEIGTPSHPWLASGLVPGMNFGVHGVAYGPTRERIYGPPPRTQGTGYMEGPADAEWIWEEGQYPRRARMPRTETDEEALARQRQNADTGRVRT